MSRLTKHERKLLIVEKTFGGMALASTVVAVAGGASAYLAGAPAWALFLFAAVFLSNVPLGGVVGFVFSEAKREPNG